MFDNEFRSVGDAAVLAAITESTVAESAAAARRLAAMAELASRRCGGEERAHWSCDEWDAAAAEVSAAAGLSHGRAGSLMDLGLTLRLRLPRVAELFRAGALSMRVVSAIAWRTHLVQDPGALAIIDVALAGCAPEWSALSQFKLEQAIDVWVDRYDPGALRRSKVSADSRDVTIGGGSPETGTSALWGRLLAGDAAAVDRRLTQMAHGVCENDPRTVRQRRADALGALAAGAMTLVCQCGNSECAAGGPDARATNVVIHVIADSEAAEGGSAAIIGGGAIPVPLLKELVRGGAKVRELRRPPDAAEGQYRPSTALDEFVRMRDMTCRFPNCDKPAEACDVDHAIPWPFGPTHPSNLRCLCRKHHLLKTFWTGDAGWRDEQSPDGSIVWTSPTGQTYTTRPGSRLLFPKWDTTTGRLTKMHVQVTGERGLMMPTRRRTRATERAYRIGCERALNDERVADHTRPPPF